MKLGETHIKNRVTLNGVILMGETTVGDDVDVEFAAAAPPAVGVAGLVGDVSIRNAAAVASSGDSDEDAAIPSVATAKSSSATASAATARARSNTACRCNANQRTTPSNGTRASCTAVVASNAG